MGTQDRSFLSDLWLPARWLAGNSKHEHEPTGLDAGWLHVAGKSTRTMCELTIVFVLGFPLLHPVSHLPHRLKPPPTCRCQTSSSSSPASNHSWIFLHPFFLTGNRGPVNGARRKRRRKKKIATTVATRATWLCTSSPLHLY